MDLQSQLNTKRENEGGYIPSMAAQIRDADNNRIETDIPNTGEQALNFSLPKEDGYEVSLEDLLINGPVILNFFRGNFCEFCLLELKALQRSLHEFQRYNATLVGISPSFISIQTLGTGEAPVYSYSILSDIGNKVAASYGLRYKVSTELENMFVAMGMDLKEMFGENEDHTLSIPATFVVNINKKIIFKFADTDYTKRAEPADIIASLISVSK